MPAMNSGKMQTLPFFSLWSTDTLNATDLYRNNEAPGYEAGRLYIQTSLSAV